jgi:hypothetical protein
VVSRQSFVFFSGIFAKHQSKSSSKPNSFDEMNRVIHIEKQECKDSMAAAVSQYPLSGDHNSHLVNTVRLNIRNNNI